MKTKLFLAILTLFAMVAQDFCHAGESKRYKKYRKRHVFFSNERPSNMISMKDFVKVKAGTFVMSSRDGENNRDEIEHEVTITQDYWIGKFEVTQSQWVAVMGKNPSKNRAGGNYPVENVSWNDVMRFCRILNQQTEGQRPKGYEYSVPTEAQWEYAALGGEKGRKCKYAGNDNLDAVAWHRGSAKGKMRQSHPVGTLKPNELGIYDMSGNVSEWCWDKYKMNLTTKPQTDPTGAETGNVRSRRGGCFRSEALRCRVRYRAMVGDPGSSASNLGFRLALVPVKKQETQEE